MRDMILPVLILLLGYVIVFFELFVISGGDENYRHELIRTVMPLMLVASLLVAVALWTRVNV